MKNILNTTIILLIAGLFVFAANCGGSEAVIKDKDGRSVSKVEELKDGKKKLIYNAEKEGEAQKQVILNNDTVEEVEYLKDSKLEKKVTYDQGKIKDVIIYNEDGSVRGITHYKDGKAASVDLPAQKKRVIYDAEGKIEKVEELE